MATLSACLPTMHSLFNRVFSRGRPSSSTQDHPHPSKDSQTRPDKSSGSRATFGRHPYRSMGTDYSAFAVRSTPSLAREPRDDIDLGDLVVVRSGSGPLAKETGITVTTDLEQTSDRLEQSTTVGHVDDRVGLQNRAS